MKMSAPGQGMSHRPCMRLHCARSQGMQGRVFRAEIHPAANRNNLKLPYRTHHGFHSAMGSENVYSVSPNLPALRRPVAFTPLSPGANFWEPEIPPIVCLNGGTGDIYSRRLRRLLPWKLAHAVSGPIDRRKELAPDRLGRSAPTPGNRGLVRPRARHRTGGRRTGRCWLTERTTQRPD